MNHGNAEVGVIHKFRASVVARRFEMGAAFVILGAISFGLGFALLKIRDLLLADATQTSVGLFLIASILLTSAIMLDRINKALR